MKNGILYRRSCHDALARYEDMLGKVLEHFRPFHCGYALAGQIAQHVARLEVEETLGGSSVLCSPFLNPYSPAHCMMSPVSLSSSPRHLRRLALRIPLVKAMFPVLPD